MANMHLVTGYAGQAHITAADDGALNIAIFGSGEFVFDYLNQHKLVASIINNNTVRVGDGDIMMQGRHVRLNPGNYVDLTIENGESGKSRIDLIVARYTKDPTTGTEEVNLAVIKGTAATSAPSVPAYTYGNIINGNVTKHEMPLYNVIINGTSILGLERRFDRMLIGRDFAPSEHYHDASDITTGVIPEKHGGTGVTSLADNYTIRSIQNTAERADALAQSLQSEISRLWARVNSLS